MATFKDLLAVQKTEIDLLQRLIRNFGKDGKERKTLDYLEEKQVLFTEKYQRISINNTTLERTKPTDCDQDYFNKNVFDEIRLLYMSVHEQIKTKIAELEQSSLNAPITAFGSLEDPTFSSPEKTLQTVNPKQQVPPKIRVKTKTIPILRKNHPITNLLNS